MASASCSGVTSPVTIGATAVTEQVTNIIIIIRLLLIFLKKKKFFQFLIFKKLEISIISIQQASNLESRSIDCRKVESNRTCYRCSGLRPAGRVPWLR